MTELRLLPGRREEWQSQTGWLTLWVPLGDIYGSTQKCLRHILLKTGLLSCVFPSVLSQTLTLMKKMSLLLWSLLRHKTVFQTKGSTLRDLL